AGRCPGGRPWVPPWTTQRRTSMRPASRAALALFAIVALAAATQPGADAGQPRQSPARQRQTASVTLITGDRVTVYRGADGRLVTGVERGSGRDGVGFVMHRHGDGVEVLPSDALPFIDAGVVDRRLFDV